MFVVLKIIGWIILGILGLILGILLFVLFSAIRYQIDGSKNGKPEGKVKITWLFRIVSATAVYRDGLSVQAKLFGRTVWKTGGGGDSPKKRKEENPSGQNGTSEGEGIYFLEPDDGDLSPVRSSGSASPLEDNDICRDNSPENAGKEKSAGRENAGCGQPQDPDTDPDGLNEKPLPEKGRKRRKRTKRIKRGTENIKDRLCAFGRRVKEWILSVIQKARFSIRLICGKLKQAEDKVSWAKEKWEAAREYIQNPANRKSAKLILRQAKKILTHPLPRKGHGTITFGVEDPYQMGQILSAASLAYPFVHKHISVHPVFGQKLLEGEIHIRGRIRPGVLLGHVLRLLLDGNIRKQLWNLIRPSKNPKNEKLRKATAES